MKILFPIYAYYPSQIGGPANTVYWHCEALVKNNLNVVVLTTTRGISGEMSREENLDLKKQVIYIPFNNYSNFKLLYKSLKLLTKIDAVHFSSLFYWPNFFIAFFAVLFGKKIIWSPRGETSKNALIYGSSLKRFYIFLLRLFIKKNILFHSTCEKETKEVIQAFGNDIKIIEMPNYMALKTQAISSSHDYFLFVGRLHPIKAIDNLIIAASHSSSFMSSKYKLKIAGDIDGTKDSIDFKKKIFRLVEDLNLTNKIEFIGHVEENKEKLYANAYFLILPSHTENFGNVVIESLAQGTPIIASIGTPWEVLRVKKAGYWVYNDIESLSKTITTAIEMSDEQYLFYRNNALDLVNDVFDIDKNIYKWLDIYNSRAK